MAKVGYTVLVCIIVPIYWHELGPTNFLWFSDIALIALVAAVWLENRLIVSTMAVSVLLLETAWVMDFMTVASSWGLPLTCLMRLNPGLSGCSLALFI